MKLGRIIGTAINAVCWAAVAGSCGFVAYNYFHQRSVAEDEIVKCRSKEDRDLVSSLSKLKEKVKDIHKKEAASEVKTVVDLGMIDKSAFYEVSKKAEEAMDTLEKNSIGGIVSSQDFTDAFKDIPDTGSLVKEIIGDAKKKSILNNRTPEDKKTISDLFDAEVKYSDLLAKERGYLPNFWGCIHAFAVDMKRRGMPKFAVYMICGGPAAILFAVGAGYCFNVCRVLRDVYYS